MFRQGARRSGTSSGGVARSSGRPCDDSKPYAQLREITVTVRGGRFRGPRQDRRDSRRSANSPQSCGDGTCRFREGNERFRSCGTLGSQPTGIAGLRRRTRAGALPRIEGGDEEFMKAPLHLHFLVSLGLFACSAGPTGSAAQPLGLQGTYEASVADAPIARSTSRTPRTSRRTERAPRGSATSLCVMQTGTYALSADETELSLTDATTGETTSLPFDALSSADDTNAQSLRLADDTPSGGSSSSSPPGEILPALSVHPPSRS